MENEDRNMVQALVAPRCGRTDQAFQEHSSVRTECTPQGKEPAQGTRQAARQALTDMLGKGGQSRPFSFWR